MPKEQPAPLLSRRNLLSGRWRNTASAPRPPWTITESAFIAGCTRCHACIKQCPSGVLVIGDGGFPTLDFSQAECTFCQKCADACALPLFDLQQPPWNWRASLQGACLAHQGVECRSCQDSCEPRALRFTPRLGGVAQPTFVISNCTGCGACVRSCPNNAIAMTSIVASDAIVISPTNIPLQSGTQYEQ